jgi:hypothetical protein
MILSSVQAELTTFSRLLPVVNLTPAPPFEEGDLGTAIAEAAHSFFKKPQSVASPGALPHDRETLEFLVLSGGAGNGSLPDGFMLSSEQKGRLSWNR